MAHHKLMADYFCPNPVYPPNYFTRQLMLAPFSFVGFRNLLLSKKITLLVNLQPLNSFDFSLKN
jgi:hypothetical protein